MSKFPIHKYITDPLNKLSRAYQIIKGNGGLVGSFRTFWRTDELKHGKLVGKDKYGNTYFENDHYFIGTNRWVHFSPSVGRDFDASQVPAEWHRWLVHTTDFPPTPEGKMPVQRKWMTDHKANMSGTKDEYVPYSTAKPKIQAWQPPKS